MNTSELIEKRNEILNKMTEYFMKAKGVIGIFLSGSLVEGNWDEFSDIDFRVIIEDEYIDDYINNRLLAPENWGELLYNEYSLGWRNMCVSHFKPFVKADVFYYRENDLVPSLWHNKGIKIILDKSGKISEVIQQSKKLKIENNINEISISIDKGFALIHEVYRRAKRNELVYANDLLNALRQKLIEFDDVLNDRIYEGSSHYERRGDGKILKTLHDSYSSKNQIELLDVLYKLTDMFEIKRVELVEKFEITRNQERDRYALEVVKNL